MSEPIRLYDVHGVEHVFYSPSTAHAQVVAGLLFEQPPVQPLPVPTPDDTQEVDAVPAPKRRKRGGGGVL